jgi:hypothetical protein
LATPKSIRRGNEIIQQEVIIDIEGRSLSKKLMQRYGKKIILSSNINLSIIKNKQKGVFCDILIL